MASITVDCYVHCRCYVTVIDSNRSELLEYVEVSRSMGTRVLHVICYIIRFRNKSRVRTEQPVVVEMRAV